MTNFWIHCSFSADVLQCAAASTSLQDAGYEQQNDRSLPGGYVDTVSSQFHEPTCCDWAYPPKETDSGIRILPNVRQDLQQYIVELEKFANVLGS